MASVSRPCDGQQNGHILRVRLRMAFRARVVSVRGRCTVMYIVVRTSGGETCEGINDWTMTRIRKASEMRGELQVERDKCHARKEAERND